MTPPSLRDLLLGGLCLAVPALGVCLYLVHERLGALPTEAVEPAQLTPLHHHLQALDEVQQDFSDRLAQQASRLSALEVQSDVLQAGAVDSVTRLERLQQTLEQAPWQAELRRLGERLARLEQLKAPRPRVAAAQPTSKSRSQPWPRRVDSRRQPAPSPFELLSLERRGGELFLSVAPTGQRTLRAVRLLQVGERFGAWQLQALTARTARFRVAGQADRTLPVPLSGAPAP